MIGAPAQRRHRIGKAFDLSAIELSQEMAEQGEIGGVVVYYENIWHALRLQGRSRGGYLQVIGASRNEIENSYAFVVDARGELFDSAPAPAGSNAFRFSGEFRQGRLADGGQFIDHGIVVAKQKGNKIARPAKR
jgi:hypothetical protein